MRMLKVVQEKLRTQKTQNILLLLLTIGLFIYVLAPLLIIAFYGVKNADDFLFFRAPEVTWQQTHSLWQLMKQEAGSALAHWQGWQGTYFYFWFGKTIMGICGDQYYFVGAWLSFASLIVGEGVLFHVVLRKIMKADKIQVAILTLSCLMMQLLLMQAPAQAFYWFNSSVLYVFPYGLSLLLMALSIYLPLYGPYKRVRLIGLEAGLLFLMIAVGGSNFLSAILVLLFFVLLIFALWMKKNKYRVFMTVNSVIYLAAVLLNVGAPGNRARMGVAVEDGYQGYSAFMTIVQSLKEAVMYMARWMVLPYILSALLLLPLLLQIVKKTKFRYPLPALVSVVSFGIFAAMFAPNIYALGIIGEGRVQNLYRLTMALWLYGNELYWAGYFVRRLKETGYTEKETEKTSYIFPGWCIGIVLLIISMKIWGGTTVTTTSAIDALRKGEAQQYRQEYEARKLILEDESIREVYFKPYTVVPYILSLSAVHDETSGWLGNIMETLYNKDVVEFLKE